MKIHKVPATQLCSEQMSQWSNLQLGNADLSSPMFRCELFAETAKLRPEVEVAVLREAGETVGFVPYLRNERNVGRPFAGCLAGLQGAITSTSTNWDPWELIRECGLTALRFDNLLASQTPLQPFHQIMGESPYMDLSNGFEAYRQERREAKSDELKETLRKSRKLERDAGVVRFEPYCRDPRVLDTLLQWKNEQLEKMRVCNQLTQAWVKPLMLRLMELNHDQFAGMLSAVFVNDEPLAISMGIRSNTVIHGWVTAYNMRFAKYSPGLILYAKIAQVAEELGIQRIDMGKGPEPYKKSFRSGGLPLAEAAIDTRVLHGVAQRGYAQLKAQARNSRFGKHASIWLSRWRYARQQFFEPQRT